MQIAKVCGTVVSTLKPRSMTGVKLLLLQFIDAARIEDGQNNRPLDAMVVGIIDTITVENRTLYSKRDEFRQSG